MPQATAKLTAAELRYHCDPKQFNFKSTANLPAFEGIIGQEKALRALTFGIDIKSHGFHVFALGEVGTGKFTTIHKFLHQDGKGNPIPNDWLYVNNFEDKDKPRTLSVPAGVGHKFRDDMDQLVEELKTEVPKAFEGKEYQQEQEGIEQNFQRRSKELFQELDKKAEERNFKLAQTAQGMAAFPIVDGKVITPETDIELKEKQLAEIEANQEKLQKEIMATLRQIEELQKKGREKIHNLDRKIIGFAVNHLIKYLKEKYAGHKNIVSLLAEVRTSLMNNIPVFKQIRQPEQTPAQYKMLAGQQEPSFEEYRVNLVVDNSKTEGTPVIVEKNPHGPNLIGRIEQEGWFGTLVTNFRMIKCGSLHKANGGYLIIEAYELLQQPYAWFILKRALKNREITIESMGEALGAFMTRTIEPEPIPLDVKIILIGSPHIYYLLYKLDQDFKELFKVKADFGQHMPRKKGSEHQYAQYIATICKEEKLLHFSPTGVAKVIEYGARLVDHKEKLATKFGEIVDIVRQASYWARQAKHKLVKAEDVQKTIEEKTYRSNRIEELIQEMMDEGTIMISSTGKQVGQLNGLSVLSLGDYSFGKPTRITARTYVGGKGVVNIEREVEMAGPIHNKGLLILSGYFGGKFAQKSPLAFSASITFEQTYEEIEGDSASSTEIYALLSSLADLPLRQDLAVTGSVNQFGQIQPIGGANEKIEGFYQVCKQQGLNGKQGVLIPRTNVKHLMLREEIVEAVKNNQFHVYAVATIDEGIALLTGKPAKTVYKLVQQQLSKLTKRSKVADRKK